MLERLHAAGAAIQGVSAKLAYVLCVTALVLVRFDLTEAAPATPRAQPVIIDTDIGDDIDDAFALTIALQDPRLEVIGITTAWGDTRTRTLLVRRLLATLGRQNVVVAEGPATPNSVPFTQKKWAIAATDTTPAPDAIEFIRNQVRNRPGEITLIALAPLSNIEALQRRDPDALHKLKQVVLMGGSIYAGYNQGGAIPTAQPSPEYNVVSAPRGLGVLLESRIPVKMFPLDSTQIKFDEVRRDRLFAYGSPASDALALLYHQWRLLNSWGQITPTLFDAVPVVWLLQPSTCPLTAMRITVDEHGYTRRGTGAPNVAVCLAIDENATQRLIMDTLAPQSPGGPTMKSLPSSGRGMVAFVLALLSMTVPFAVAQPPADLVVYTAAGAVAGAGSEILAFKGIPYAGDATRLGPIRCDRRSQWARPAEVAPLRPRDRSLPRARDPDSYRSRVS
jgi:inosine-uridine nucleoside N-ribohydrolase